jgi:FAD/FMN-containing dehydrogenase
MKLSGWGNFPKNKITITNSLSLKSIVYGNGRSYGDSSIGETTYINNSKGIVEFSLLEKKITVHSGTTFDEILKYIVPKGFFLPTTPGTKYLTAGGAVASDVHGKNHHKVGSFGNFVSKIVLDTGEDTKVLTLIKNSDLFKATIGGMGLTGLIKEIEFSVIPIKSSFILRRRIITLNLLDTFKAFDRISDTENSVAWIDCLAKGKKMGRSIIDYGNFDNSNNKLSVHKKPFINIPFFFPSFFLRKWFVRIFNSIYYRLGKFNNTEKSVHYDEFFYPLDKVLNWNKIYGKKGFIQYQFVVEKKRSFKVVSECMEIISEYGIASFLCVLKEFGNIPSHGLLSFPMEGYTLALDIPITNKTFELVEKLNVIVKKNHGKIYLSKDSSLEDLNLVACKKNLTEFKKIRKLYNFKFESFQSKRLGL